MARSSEPWPMYPTEYIAFSSRLTGKEGENINLTGAETPGKNWGGGGGST